jgi:hypothetical protein
MNSTAFRHALRSLSHPAAIAAIALILVNDHVLKPFAPSWLTGKLSDAAWLVIAPLVTAAVLALVAPQKAGRAVGPLTFLLCAGCFTLLKVSPESNHWLLEPARRLTGIPWYTASDLSDLAALPALGVGWLVWARSKGEASRRSGGRWPVLALAALALIADAPAPFHGIACLRQDGDNIVASSDFGGGSYVSADGGMSWQSASPGSNGPQGCNARQSAWEISPPDGGQVRYRLVYGAGIDRSADGGQTWAREVELNGGEARYYYYRKFYSYGAGTGPYDAIFDAGTGNLVVAIGFEGALVRDGQGRWTPVAVGQYRREALSSDQVISLVSGEMWLAGIALLLMLALLNVAAVGFRRLTLVLSVIGWALWGFGVLLSPAGFSGSDYVGGPMLTTATFLSAADGITMLITGEIWTRSVSSLLRIGLVSLGGALLFFIPFLLWGQGAIPSYQTAQIAGVVMLIVLLASSFVLIRKNRQASGEVVNP